MSMKPQLFEYSEGHHFGVHPRCRCHMLPRPPKRHRVCCRIPQNDFLSLYKPGMMLWSRSDLFSTSFSHFFLFHFTNNCENSCSFWFPTRSWKLKIIAMLVFPKHRDTWWRLESFLWFDKSFFYRLNGAVLTRHRTEVWSTHESAKPRNIPYHSLVTRAQTNVTWISLLCAELAMSRENYSPRSHL